MTENPAKKITSKHCVLTPQQEKWKNIAFWFCGIFLFLFLGELVIYLVIWNFNDWTCVLLLQILLIMPAYLSNAGMLLFGKGGRPLDKNFICKDGNPLFGQGKTIKGLILGPLFGIAVSIVIHLILILTWSGIETIIRVFWGGARQYILFASAPETAVNLFKVYMTGAYSSESLLRGFPRLIIRVILVSFGAAAGDLAGSWLKRRLKKQRGEPIWGLDQLDFIIPAVLFGMGFVVLNVNFIAIFIFILIFTPSMAVISNTVAYLIGLKSVPY